MHPWRLVADGVTLLNLGNVLYTGPNALLILNQPFTDIHCFDSIWSSARFKVCADGGYQKLHEYVTSQALRPEDFRPDVILGDLDSIDDATLREAKLAAIEIVEIRDQSENDFQKAIRYIIARLRGVCHGPLNIVVLGALDGRFDHTAASLSLLHEYPDERIWLISPHSVVTLVPAGKTCITLDRSIEGSTCGLIPFAGPAIVTTGGLKWNLKNQRMSMGGLISSSNELLDDLTIEVETDHPLVWTIDFQNPLALRTN